jgi:hypothetical protein
VIDIAVVSDPYASSPPISSNVIAREASSSSLIVHDRYGNKVPEAPESPCSSPPSPAPNLANWYLKQQNIHMSRRQNHRIDLFRGARFWTFVIVYTKPWMAVRYFCCPKRTVNPAPPPPFLLHGPLQRRIGHNTHQCSLL